MSSIYKLKLEDQLLLCCARTQIDPDNKKKIKYLIKRELEWIRILELASRHKLTSLLFFNLNSICAEEVPGDILSYLNSFFLENIKKNLLLTGELVKIIKVLEENGINAITYKGPVIALLAYGSIGLRQFNDLDILINRSVALTAKNILMSNGYKLYEEHNVSDSVYLNLESEFILINEKNGIKVEINWNFEGNFFTFGNDPKILFNNLSDVDINGSYINTFSSSNQLLALSIHAAKHDWCRLSWICDISEFIKNENIDWDETINKAEILCVERILLISLFLSKDLFGLELPEMIISHLNSDSSVKKISLQIKKRIFLENATSYTILEKFFLDIRKREKLVFGIKDCFKNITRPSYNDFKHIHLPQFLFPLYYIIRPFLLIMRYGKQGLY